MSHKNIHISGRMALCLILGGGIGKRLYPLTVERSKPAVPFGGNYRLIDIPISNSINSGINRIFVLTQYNSASLNRHITQTYKFDIFHNGFVDILATEQTMDNATSGFSQGTADAVRRALRHLNPFREAGTAPYILILSGDQLYRMDFRKVLAKHVENNADITIGIIPVETEEINRFGILKVDKNCKVLDFMEKPTSEDQIKGWDIPSCFKPKDSNKKYFGSMGIYIFNIEVLYDLLLTHPEMLDFGKEVIPYAIKSGYRTFGYIHDGYWEDIGTIKSFHSANIELTKENPAFDLYSLGMPFFSHPRFLPPSRIISSEIKNCLISDGVFIENAYIQSSVIGVRSIIRKGVRIENSVIMGCDYYEHEESSPKHTIPVGIGENTIIKNAIIDKNCRIGKNVRIVNEEGVLNKKESFYSIVDGIIVITKNSVVPDNTVI